MKKYIRPLVKDIKTGKLYNPEIEFEKALNKSKDIFIRLKNC